MGEVNLEASNMQENISITPPPPPPVNKNVQNMFRFCNTIYCNEFKQIFIQVQNMRYCYKLYTTCYQLQACKLINQFLFIVKCNIQFFYHKNTLMLTFKRSILMLNVFNLAYCQASNDLFDYIYYLLSLPFQICAFCTFEYIYPLVPGDKFQLKYCIRRNKV